jgi:hypothetical protein
MSLHVPGGHALLIPADAIPKSSVKGRSRYGGLAHSPMRRVNNQRFPIQLSTFRFRILCPSRVAIQSRLPQLRNLLKLRKGVGCGLGHSALPRDMLECIFDIQGLQSDGSFHKRAQSDCGRCTIWVSKMAYILYIVIQFNLWDWRSPRTLKTELSDWGPDIGRVRSYREPIISGSIQPNCPKSRSVIVSKALNINPLNRSSK